MRLSNALVAGLLLGALASGCGSDPPTPKPMPTPSRTTPSPSVPQPDLSKYSEKEKQAWAEAYSTLEEFYDGELEFMKVGKATPEAKAFYQEHALIWAPYWDNLRTIELNNITVKGGARELWAKPTRIKFAADGSAAVTVSRCVDNRRLIVFQDGKQVPQSGRPAVSNIELSRFAGAPWKISYAKEDVAKC